jgi:hypothetical protein
MLGQLGLFNFKRIFKDGPLGRPRGQPFLCFVGSTNIGPAEKEIGIYKIRN